MHAREMTCIALLLQAGGGGGGAQNDAFCHTYVRTYAPRAATNTNPPCDPPTDRKYLTFDRQSNAFFLSKTLTLSFH